MSKFFQTDISLKNSTNINLLALKKHIKDLTYKQLVNNKTLVCVRNFLGTSSTILQKYGTYEGGKNI